MDMELPAIEFLALELPPDCSVWVVESPDDPDDLEGREIEVKVPDGTAKRYMVEQAERLVDVWVSLSLRLVKQQ
jgi:hypothetical protein